MQEVQKGRDAMIAAWRCLEAIVDCDDVFTREALWKAAKRYAERARAERRGESVERPARTLTRFGMSEGLENAAQRVIAE